MNWSNLEKITSEIGYFEPSRTVKKKVEETHEVFVLSI